MVEQKYVHMVYRIHGFAMFLDARFKDRIASNKVEFRAKVSLWIKEECGQEDDVSIDDETGLPCPINDLY